MTAVNTMQQKILILAAIPHGLRLDKEIREIESAIARATKRELFQIKFRTAVRPQDIRRVIAEERPHIVHFCGHGIEGGLVLEDDGGNNKLVSPQGLAALFELHADYVKCVLLNACYSVTTADAIVQHIDYAIGMNNEIGDQAAIAFSTGFYDAIGYDFVDQDMFYRAYKEGIAAIKLENFNEGETPVFKKNENLTTSRLEIPLLSKEPVPKEAASESDRELNDSDIEILTDLLIRSGRAEYSARRGLCIKIGIAPNYLGFLRESTDTDFSLQLINHLHTIDEKPALCKICKELEVIFRKGKYSADLEKIKSKLNCK